MDDGRTRSRRKNGGERHSFASPTTSLELDGRCDLNFADAWADVIACNAEQARSKLDGVADEADLVGVFHHSRALDELRSRTQSKFSSKEGA